MNKRLKAFCAGLLALLVVYIAAYICDSIYGGYYLKAENDSKSRFEVNGLSLAAFTACLWQPRFGYAGWSDIDPIGRLFYPAIFLDRRFFHHTVYATDPGISQWVQNLSISNVHPHSRAEFDDDRRLFQANDGYLIVPGKQVGPLTLGMTDKQVTAALGEGSRTQFPGMGVEWWPADAHNTLETAHFFSTYTPEDGGGGTGGGIAMIRVTSGSFATASGVCAFSGLTQIWNAFPNIRWSQELASEAGILDTYDDEENGIAFQIWRVRAKHPRRCSAILVHQSRIPLAELPDLKQPDTDDLQEYNKHRQRYQ